jgi:hypothetical protein
MVLIVTSHQMYLRIAEGEQTSAVVGRSRLTPAKICRLLLSDDCRDDILPDEIIRIEVLFWVAVNM